jgi:hypothetical protein
MPKDDLEARLTSLTQEFVGRLVDAIRNASFAEVAALPSQKNVASAPRALTLAGRRPNNTAHADRGAGRQTAVRRAELAERVVRALRSAGEPLGVRALSNDLGVAPDILGTPLRELRSAGRIKKHGEKRATRYSLSE